MNLMKYKDYEGTASVDMERQVCHGKVLFIDDLVTYEADAPAELIGAFHEAVDDYIETCVEIGKRPNKAIKGAFNVRVPIELHKSAIRRSIELDTSLNEIIVKALDMFLNGNTNVNHVTNYFVQSDKPSFKSYDVTASGTAINWVNRTNIARRARSGN